MSFAVTPTQVSPSFSMLMLMKWNERLNYRDTRKVLLREIRKCRKRLLSCLPFFSHILTNDGSNGKKKRHRNQGEHCEKRIHSEHLEHSDTTKQKRIEEHKRAVAKGCPDPA